MSFAGKCWRKSNFDLARSGEVSFLGMIAKILRHHVHKLSYGRVVWDTHDARHSKRIGHPRHITNAEAVMRAADAAPARTQKDSFPDSKDLVAVCENPAVGHNKHAAKINSVRRIAAPTATKGSLAGSGRARLSAAFF